MKVQLYPLNLLGYIIFNNGSLNIFYLGVILFKAKPPNCSFKCFSLCVGLLSQLFEIDMSLRFDAMLLPSFVSSMSHLVNFLKDSSCLLREFPFPRYLEIYLKMNVLPLKYHRHMNNNYDVYLYVSYSSLIFSFFLKQV